MNDLELFEENGQLSINVSYLLKHYELKIKEIEQIQKEYRIAIQKGMEKNGVEKFEDIYTSIEYRPENEIDVFDVDSFKAEHPELYGQYFKKRKVKAHVRIKAKL